jgi:hypothetical protein
MQLFSGFLQEVGTRPPGTGILADAVAGENCRLMVDERRFL